MKNKKLFLIVGLTLTAVFLFSSLSWADKPEAMFTAKPVGDSRTEYEIVITILHDGKGRKHYLESVDLLLNEKIYKTWVYTKEDSPEEFPFILKTNITISDYGPSIVSVKATCSSHGESARSAIQIIPGESY